jgi:uncharacterized protein YjbI with pentapeptide repeats
MNREEFLEQYNKGKRDFRGVDLSGVNLGHITLDDVNLEGATLREVKFRLSTLNNIIFRNADLDGALFLKASINDCDFRGANLRRSNIHNTSIVKVNRDLSIVDLLVRYQDGERDFPGIKIVDNPRFHADWGLVDLKGFDLRGINLRGADLRDVNLSGTNLSGSDLAGICLQNSLLDAAIIRDANLYAAHLTNCGLRDADLGGSILDHINASSACFDRAKLPFFEHAILVEASFRDAWAFERHLCDHGNFIWKTIMPDGTIRSQS